MNEGTKNTDGGSQPHMSIGVSLDEAFKIKFCSVVHGRGLPGVGEKGRQWGQESVIPLQDIVGNPFP